MASAISTQQTSTKGIADLLEELSALLASPVDADSFEAVRSQLVEQLEALRGHLKMPPSGGPSSTRHSNLDPGLPGRQDAQVVLDLALQSETLLYAAAIWVERVPLILTRYGQVVAEQVMQVCSQQVISRIMRPQDQLFYWGGAGLLALLQRDENVHGVRSELMRMLATPVNQYFETEHRTIYLPIRMSGDLFPVIGTPEDLQSQIQKYFSARS